MIIHESGEFSSITDKKITNQLVEMFQNNSDLAESSLKFEEIEEIKEEIDTEHFFAKPSSTKTSPYSKTYNHAMKPRFDKVLISPINRPMNIVKIHSKSNKVH